MTLSTIRTASPNSVISLYQTAKLSNEAEAWLSANAKSFAREYHQKKESVGIKVHIGERMRRRLDHLQEKETLPVELFPSGELQESSKVFWQDCVMLEFKELRAGDAKALRDDFSHLGSRAESAINDYLNATWSSPQSIADMRASLRLMKEQDTFPYSYHPQLEDPSEYYQSIFGGFKTEKRITSRQAAQIRREAWDLYGDGSIGEREFRKRLEIATSRSIGRVSAMHVVE